MDALKRLDADGTIEIQEAVVVEKDHEGGIHPEDVFRHAAAGEDFARQVNSSMPPGSSAILMLVRKRDPDAAIAELGRYGGKALRTTLPDEVEDQLRSTLGQPAGPA